MKIKKGDNVIIIAGKDKGKKGKVVRALPKSSAVVVEGANIRKRHQKPRQRGQKGQILEVATPIHISNVMFIDPKTGVPTRVGTKIVGGVKKRITKKSGTVI